MNSRTSRPRIADQHDHVDVATRAPCEHTEQGALADTRRREDAETLPFTERHQAIDRANAGDERHLDQRARHRIGRRGVDRRLRHGLDRTRAVDRLAETVDHAPEQARSDADRERFAAAVNPRGARQADRAAERREQRKLPVEAHYFRELQTLAGAVAQLADFAQRRIDAAHLQQGSGGFDDLADLAAGGNRVQRRVELREKVHACAHARPPSG